MRYEAHRCGKRILIVALAVIAALTAAPVGQAQTLPEPVVAIHVSELTQALDTPGGVWWPSWHYFVMPESLKEALNSDGTKHIEVSDAAIAAGILLHPDGSPRYPILISLASEAVSDGEAAQLLEYVNAGGFLFIGSSAFTRNSDGTARGDFALATEMGLSLSNPDPAKDWYQNSTFTKTRDHRLTSHIPAGTLTWRMPLNSEEFPLGVSPGHPIYGQHWVLQVAAAGATVIVNNDVGPLLAVTPHGKGTFIFHGAAQPLVAHGGYDSGLYSYLIYRNAIEWAFEATNVPIVKLSPWRYDYNAAFLARHDFENDPARIQSISDSAAFENNLGVKGDYYFCTGTLREEMVFLNKINAVLGLQSAVSNFGATIGSHNGGLPNPVNTSLSIGDFDYWHWGPDEALDVTTFPTATFDSGSDYAAASILMSFQDIEGWLAGLDNGRPGCGFAGTCPRIWASPLFNSVRDDSFNIVEGLGAVISMGEQKIGPFPHWTLSTKTAGKRYTYVSLPVTEWYQGASVAQVMEYNDVQGGGKYSFSGMREAVDFHYNLGALVAIYGHGPSTSSNIQGDYVVYAAGKPRMWLTNAVELFDWWQARSDVNVPATYTVAGNTATITALVSGSDDPDTAIEVAVPNLTNPQAADFDVSVNGSTAEYRMMGKAVKIRVGVSPAAVEVRYPVPADVTPPYAPSVSGATPTNDTTPTWSWTAGGGGNGVYRYKLDNSGLTTGATTTTSAGFTPSSALSSGIHTLYVQERDDAGNWSDSGSFGVMIDTVAPALTISAPSAATANAGNGPVTFTVTYLGADTVTLAAADVTLNATGTAHGAVAVSGDGAGTRTVTISHITGYGVLGITIEANTAVDGAGNKAASAGPSATFTVNNNSGDFDGDGVNVNDAIKALRIAAGLDTQQDSDLVFGDVAPWVNGQLLPDGKIDIGDVVVILRKAVGLSTW